MGGALVSFEDPHLGSASVELEALGLAFIELALVHCQEILRGTIDHRRLLPFTTYNGVEMFQAMVANDFIVFSVEQDQMNDLKITIMFAGRHGQAATAGLGRWNGDNYQELKANIILPRAIAWFN